MIPFSLIRQFLLDEFDDFWELSTDLGAYG